MKKESSDFAKRLWEEITNTRQRRVLLSERIPELDRQEQRLRVARLESLVTLEAALAAVREIAEKKDLLDRRLGLIKESAAAIRDVRLLVDQVHLDCDRLGLRSEASEFLQLLRALVEQ